MSGARASAARAGASWQGAPAPPLVLRRHAHLPPPASLSAIPAERVVQRKCDGCENEEKEEMPVQPRLEVGPVGDRYEVEADRIADRVMAMREGDVSEAAPAVQRACSACSSRDELRARRDGGPETVAASEGELTRGGAPLPGPTRSFFETRMGRDLSGVRVHTGEGAQALSGSIRARAFTYRDHIWLGSGESAAPTFTMAHELAHVMQQTAPGPLGPVADHAGEAQPAPAAIQRKDFPFWLPGTTTGAKGLHQTMHDQGQTALVGANPGTLSEVPMPGATRDTIAPGEKCGYADLYFAGSKGAKQASVPGVEARPAAAPAGGGAPAMDIGNFAKGESTASCATQAKFGSVGGLTSFEAARAPIIENGVITRLDTAPTNIRLGEIKPAHDPDYRADGVAQLKNYISGLNTTIDATNKKLTGTSWAGNPKVMSPGDLTIPSGWDAKADHTDWPQRDLKIRSYKTVRGTTPTTAPAGGKKKQKKAVDTKSGSTQSISGRWMLSEDSKRPDNEGIYVYFLAPKPDDLAAVLGSYSVDPKFRSLEKRVTAIQKPLMTTPDVKKAPRKRPLPLAATPAPANRVRRTATDKFRAVEWEAMRRGHKDLPKESKGNLLEKFDELAPDEMREGIAQTAAMAEWAKDNPDNVKLDTKVTKAATDTAAVSDFGLLKKLAFWTGIEATPLGILRERLGILFVKGFKAFEAAKAKLKKVFGGAHFKPKGSSSIGAHAVKILAKVLAQFGKVILVRTADVMADCLKQGFVDFMKAKVEGEIDFLIETANDVQTFLADLEKDILGDLQSRFDAVTAEYESTIKKIAEDAEVIKDITSAVTEIVRIARMAFCASGLTAAGWGAIVTCLLSIADWVASKFDASPLDWIIKRVMESCRGRRIFAQALLGFESVRSLPTTLAKLILGQVKEALPKPVQAMVCDLDALKVPDLSIADFECVAGEGGDGDAESEGEGGGTGGTGGAGGTGGTGDGGGDKEAAPGEGAPGSGAQPGDGGGDAAAGEQKGEARDSTAEESSGGGGGDGKGAGAPPAGTSSVHQDTVKDGKEAPAKGTIESGVKSDGSDDGKTLTAHLTISAEGHTFTNHPAKIHVKKTFTMDDGKKYAEVYFPADTPIMFKVCYPAEGNPCAEWYEWSPHRGEDKVFILKFKEGGGK